MAMNKGVDAGLRQTQPSEDKDEPSTSSCGCVQPDASAPSSSAAAPKLASSSATDTPSGQTSKVPLQATARSDDESDAELGAAVAERRKTFYSEKQREGESARNYIYEMTVLASECDFKDTEAELKKTITAGLLDNKPHKAILLVTDLASVSMECFTRLLTYGEKEEPEGKPLKPLRPKGEEQDIPQDMQKADVKAYECLALFLDLGLLPEPDTMTEPYFYDESQVVALPNYLLSEKVLCVGVCTIVTFLEAVRLFVKLGASPIYSQLVANSKIQTLKKFVEACAVKSNYVTIGEARAAIDVIMELVNGDYYANTDDITITEEGDYVTVGLASTFWQLFEAIGVTTVIKNYKCSTCGLSQTKKLPAVDSSSLHNLVRRMALFEEADTCPNEKCKSKNCQSLTTLNPLGFIIYFDPAVQVRKGGLFDLPAEVPPDLAVYANNFVPRVVGAETISPIGAHSIFRSWVGDTAMLYNSNQPFFFFNGTVMRKAAPEVNFAWYLPESAFPKGRLEQYEEVLQTLMEKPHHRTIPLDLDEFPPSNPPVRRIHRIAVFKDKVVRPEEEEPLGAGTPPP